MSGSTPPRPGCVSTTGDATSSTSGSVGQPRDRDPRACYAIWDRETRDRDRSGGSSTTTRRRPRKILRRGTAADPGRSARPWGLSRRATARTRAASLVVLIASGALGALAFPATDWWLLAWVWLVPALVSGVDARRRGRPSGTAGSPAPCSTWCCCAGSTTRSSTTARSRGRSRGCPSRPLAAYCGLYVGAGGRRDRVARAAARRRARRSRSRPRCGWPGSGCAGTSWAAFRGGCSATPSIGQLAGDPDRGAGRRLRGVAGDRGGERGARRRCSPSARAGRGRGPRAAALLLAATLGFGAHALARPASSTAAGRRRGGDPAVDRADASSGIPRATRRSLDIYERLTREAAATRPAIVLWPETATTIFLRGDPELLERLRRLSAEVETADPGRLDRPPRRALAGSS